jgi:ribosomal protein S18 acetylase RimI-like enzyme
MNPLTYLLLQMGLEGKGPVGEHTIRQVQVVPDEDLPLMLLAQLADQKLVAYYSELLSCDLQAQLGACISSIEFPEIDPILDILKLHKIQSDAGHYKTYLFPQQTAANPDKSCGEAWVYTDPAYRRQGLAKKVASAWAHSLMRIGKVPFHSHKIDNVASASLAGALQLQPVFEELSIALCTS